MTSIGSNSSHVGCPEGGAAAPSARSYPRPGFAVGGGAGGHGDFMRFAAMPTPAAPAGSPERFVTSQAGGVVIGADGAPAGTIPAGSFIDTKDGKIYGADGKAITLPTGATADFFDLPDVATLLTTAAAATAGNTVAAGGPPGKPPMKTAVDGQWGPGGITPTKGGSGDCGMEHGPTRTKAGGGATTGSLASSSSVAGANGVGTVPTLEASLAELIATLRELTASMARTTGGGTPGQFLLQRPPVAPTTPPVAPAPARTTSAPSTTSSTGSGSGSGSGSTTTTPA